ncbi:MAG TPA: pre-peptidase, partial [Isosphaeraceae bacterium]|nr:pre-peptidase [Isosphaeraceae bacterium]
MSNVRTLALTVAAGLLAVSPGRTAHAQLPLPRLQSLFPAGGQAGQNVDITVAGSDFEGVNALWFDHPGLRAFHLKGLTFRVAIAPGTPPGLHDVRAVSHLGVSNPRVFLVGEWPESIEIEPNNQPDQARDLALNSVVNGSVAATDIDCFRFDGRKGQRLFVELWAARIESRLNALIRVYDPQGKEIVEGHADYAADPFLDLTLPADGRYTIKLHDVIYAGSNEYSYRLALHNGPHIDAILPAAALPGVANRFTLLGRKLGGEPRSDVLVEGHPLEAKEVTLVASGSNGELAGASPGLELVPALAAARTGFPFQAWGERGKSNPVFVAEAEHPASVEEEPNNDGAHAQRISLPCMVAGSFGKVGDADLYRFTATKGQVWWVEVYAERMGSVADPTFVIQRVDDKGATQDLATGDDLPDIG